MKTNFLLVLIIILIFSACKTDTKNNNKNNTKANLDSSQVADTNILVKKIPEQIMDYKFPNEFKFYSENMTFYDNTHTFLPIGWSKDSKIAYIQVKDFSLVPQVTIYLIIQDLVEDSIVEKLVHKVNMDLIYSETAVNIIEKYWNNDYEIIKKKLNQHKIIQTEFDFTEDIETQNNNYSIETITEHGFLYADNDIIKLDISIIRNDFNKKLIISEKKLTRFPTAGALMMLSPYENRVAILFYKQSYTDFDGCVSNYQIIGSSLEKGFK